MYREIIHQEKPQPLLPWASDSSRTATNSPRAVRTRFSLIVRGLKISSRRKGRSKRASLTANFNQQLPARRTPDDCSCTLERQDALERRLKPSCRWSRPAAGGPAHRFNSSRGRRCGDNDFTNQVRHREIRRLKPDPSDVRSRIAAAAGRTQAGPTPARLLAEDIDVLERWNESPNSIGERQPAFLVQSTITTATGGAFGNRLSSKEMHGQGYRS